MSLERPAPMNVESTAPTTEPEFPPNESEVMRRVELLVSRVLLGGVLASMATVLLGLTLMFVHHPQYLSSADDLKRLTAPSAAFPHTLGDVARGIAAGQGRAVVALGLVLLIATPIMRVAISLVGFTLENDRVYAAVSAVVLTLLAISFLLGKVE